MIDLEGLHPPRSGRGQWLIGLGMALALGAAPIQSAIAACDTTKAKSSVSFQAVVEPLLNEKCSECNITGDAPEGLMLESGVSYRFLVDVMSREIDMKRIDPGNAESSYIIYKMRGTHLEKGGIGDRMPYGKDALTDHEIDLVATWIRDCSPNN